MPTLKHTFLIAASTCACVLIFLLTMALIEAGQLIDHTAAKLRATQHRLQELEETKPINPAKVCPAWWFGHKPAQVALTRQRICGK